MKNSFVNTICFIIDDLGEIKGDEPKFFFSKSLGLVLGAVSGIVVAHAATGNMWWSSGILPTGNAGRKWVLGLLYWDLVFGCFAE